MPRSVRNSQPAARVNESRRPPLVADSLPAAYVQTPASAWQFIALLIVLALVVAIVHWPALSAKALSFDDTQYVTENKLVLHPSWANAGRFLAEIRAPSTVRGYYQPLAMISLMLDCAMGASIDNFVPFHRTSLVLHVLNSLLVAILLFLLFKNEWAAVLIALIWGLHPLTVEPIPWLGERKTLLATFFALLSLIAYLLWCQRRQKRWMAASTVMLLLALMSKPTTTPLPVLMLLLDIWPLRRLSLWPPPNLLSSMARAVMEKAPLFLLAGVFAVITVTSQGNTAGMTMPGQHDPMRIFYIIAHNTIFYLGKFFWPSNLSSHYPFPNPLTPASSAVLRGIIGSIFFLSILVVSLRWTRSLVVAWLFFFIAIFPTLGFIGFTNVIASDKYAYLPMIGFLLPLAALLSQVFTARIQGATPSASTSPRLADELSPRLRGYLPLAAILILLVVAAEARGVRRQLAYWKTTEILFDRMIVLAPNIAVLHNNYGVYLHTAGNKEKAYAHYTRAAQINPAYVDALRNVGLMHFERNELEEALKNYQAALNLMTSAVDVRSKPAVYSTVAVILRRLGRIEESIAQCREALRLNPAYPNAYVSLGNTLRQAGRPAEAIDAYKEAMRLDPEDAGSYNNLGTALGDLKRYDEALIQYRRAIEMNPKYADAYTNMGLALEGLNRHDEARSAYQEATRLDPQSGNALLKRAESLRRAGKPAEALSVFLKLIEVAPTDINARRNAAFHLQEQGKVDDAIAQYQEIIRLDPKDADTRRDLAILYQRQGKSEEALATCREALRLQPAHIEARYTLGWLYEQQSRPGEAKKEYEKVLELNPAHDRARSRLQGLPKD